MTTTTPSIARLGWGPIAAAIVLAANVVVPLVWGDVYPFTSAPMFRDNPRQCCNYRVYAPDGTELPAEAWLCHRIYDGNPVGYGVGIEPPPVLERQFGQVHTEQHIREHIERLLNEPQNRSLDHVEVVQEVIGPIDAERVGPLPPRRFIVRRSTNDQCRPAPIGQWDLVIGHFRIPCQDFPAQLG